MCDTCHNELAPAGRATPRSAKSQSLGLQFPEGSAARRGLSFITTPLGMSGSLHGDWPAQGISQTPYGRERRGASILEDVA